MKPVHVDTQILHGTVIGIKTPYANGVHLVTVGMDLPVYEADLSNPTAPIINYVDVPFVYHYPSIGQRVSVFHEFRSVCEVSGFRHHDDDMYAVDVVDEPLLKLPAFTSHAGLVHARFSASTRNIEQMIDRAINITMDDARRNAARRGSVPNAISQMEDRVRLSRTPGWNEAMDRIAQLRPPVNHEQVDLPRYTAPPPISSSGFLGRTLGIGSPSTTSSFIRDESRNRTATSSWVDDELAVNTDQVDAVRFALSSMEVKPKPEEFSTLQTRKPRKIVIDPNE